MEKNVEIKVDCKAQAYAVYVDDEKWCYSDHDDKSDNLTAGNHDLTWNITGTAGDTISIVISVGGAKLKTINGSIADGDAEELG